jgi:ParB family chromosome partitioning protein
MNKRKTLGRGIANLIPTHSEDEDKDGEVQYVDINAIDPNPYQPRAEFDADEIAGLAESIKNQGLLQPVVLRKSGGRYEIVSGERRFRAFRHLRRDSVPCIVKAKVTDNEMLELALVENIQREQLNEMEKAAAYQNLIRQCGYTHEQLAGQVGKSRAAITNTLRLLNLPEEVQTMLRKNEISTGHARAILSLEGAGQQLEAARKIASEKLTVRDAEQIARQEKPPAEEAAAKGQPARKPADGRPLDPDIARQLELMQYRFGTSVKLKITGDNRGRIEIEYFSNDDIMRIFDLLLGGAEAAPWETAPYGAAPGGRISGESPAQGQAQVSAI